MSENLAMNHGPLAPRPLPRDPLARLFDGSGLAGRTDGELLARFVASRDEAAFEGLVVRLGPMVLGVCRRMLGDRADADDAFQATFLVLVRRAGAVGRGDLIGPWLHGVAVRVCRKARAESARRRTRERTGVAVDALPLGSTLAAPSPLDQAETRATIDDAIARLPARYRHLVVLCDVEGLTRAEAADRLGWTPNMVRGRLARAREQLRATLVQRGCVPPGLASAPTEASGLIAWPWMLAPPPPLIAITVRAGLVSLTPSGRSVVATLASTSVLSLAEGVIRTMFFTSWKFVGFSLIAAGTLVTGTATVLVARQVPAPAPVFPPDARNADNAARVPPAPLPRANPTLRTLLDERLRSAQKRQEAQQFFYDEGRITVDRLIDANRQVMQAEQALADTPEQRLTSAQTSVDRLQRILDRELGELEVGRSTSADVSEVEDALIEARIILARARETNPNGPAPELAGQLALFPPIVVADPVAVPPAVRSAALDQTRVELARTLFAETSRHFPVDLTVDSYIADLDTLIEAERAAAISPAGRSAAFQAIINQVQSALKPSETLVPKGQLGPRVESKLKIALADLQGLAAGGARISDPQLIRNLDRRLTELEKKVDRVLDLLDSLSNRPRIR